MARKASKKRSSPPGKPGRVSGLHPYRVVEKTVKVQDNGTGRHVPGTPGLDIGKLEDRVAYKFVGPGIVGDVIAFGQDGLEKLTKSAVLANLAYNHGWMASANKATHVR